MARWRRPVWRTAKAPCAGFGRMPASLAGSDRIAAGGGSAGGHVAACTGVIDGFESKDEDDKISSGPTPWCSSTSPCVLAPVPGRNDFLNADNITALKERMGAEPMDLSPWHQIKKGQPPTLVLHGEKDPTVKFWTAKVFVEKSAAAGNQTELAAYPGEAHGFFNYGRDGNKMFVANAADRCVLQTTRLAARQADD